jgi:hypothetical protein
MGLQRKLHNIIWGYLFRLQRNLHNSRLRITILSDPAQLKLHCLPCKIAWNLLRLGTQQNLKSRVALFLNPHHNHHQECWSHWQCSRSAGKWSIINWKSNWEQQPENS